LSIRSRKAELTGRNYLTQDIIRRILQNYFGYDVNFVMNITDIDDKIIIRARESYLIKQTLEQNSTLTPELLETANGAFEKYLDAKLVKCLPHPVVAPSSSSPIERFEAILDKYKSDSTWASEAKTKEEKFDMYINSLVKARDAIRIAEEKLRTSDKGGAEGVNELLNASADTMGPYLGTTVG
jgi:cysteinyl-tRNA synthetase